MDPKDIPAGVRAVETLDPDGDIHVRLSHEVDLDDLLLWLAAWRTDDEDPADWWEYHGDYPTNLGPDFARELAVGRYRSMPCLCGEGHKHDVLPVAEGKSERGSYLGVMTR